MNKAEILERLTTDFSEAEHSDFTIKGDKLYIQMIEEFETILNNEQKQFFHEIDCCVNLLNGYYLEDGIRFGLKLAKSLRGILENPDEVFTEYENSLTPFEEFNSSAIEALEELRGNKKRSDNSDNLKKKIEQAVTSALKDYTS